MMASIWEPTEAGNPWDRGCTPTSPREGPTLLEVTRRQTHGRASCHFCSLLLGSHQSTPRGTGVAPGLSRVTTEGDLGPRTGRGKEAQRPVRAGGIHTWEVCSRTRTARPAACPPVAASSALPPQKPLVLGDEDKKACNKNNIRHRDRTNNYNNYLYETPVLERKM